METDDDYGEIMQRFLRKLSNCGKIVGAVSDLWDMFEVRLNRGIWTLLRGENRRKFVHTSVIAILCEM